VVSTKDEENIKGFRRKG